MRRISSSTTASMSTRSFPSPVPAAGLSRNVLKIASTNPATAEIEVASEFSLEGDQSSEPLLYQVQSAAGQTEYLAAISQFYQGWTLPQPLITALVIHPDRTIMQLLDVRDPFNVSQAWKIGARRLVARQSKDRRHIVSRQQLSAAT